MIDNWECSKFIHIRMPPPQIWRAFAPVDENSLNIIGPSQMATCAGASTCFDFLSLHMNRTVPYFVVCVGKTPLAVALMEAKRQDIRIGVR